MATSHAESLYWARPRLPISSTSDQSKTLSKQLDFVHDSMQSPGLSLLARLIHTANTRRLEKYDVMTDLSRTFLGEGATYQVVQETAAGSTIGYFNTPSKIERRAVAVKTAKVQIPQDLTRLKFNDEECRRLRSILFEIEVLSHPAIRQHPNIAAILAYTWKNEANTFAPSLVMELAVLGNARAFLSAEVLSDEQKIALCRDIATGLQFLLMFQIVHGDVKLDNILVYEDDQKGMVAKVSDLERSPQSKERLSYVGTALYNAPEVQNSLKSSKTAIIPPDQLWLCDIFSFGLLSLEVFAGVKYYGELSGGEQLVRQVMTGEKAEQNLDTVAVRVLQGHGQLSAYLLDICCHILHFTLPYSPIERSLNGWTHINRILNNDLTKDIMFAGNLAPIVFKLKPSYSILEVCTEASKLVDDGINPRLWSELKYAAESSTFVEERGKAAFDLFLCYSVGGYVTPDDESIDRALASLTSAAAAGYPPALLVGKRMFEANQKTIPDVFRLEPKDKAFAQARRFLEALPNEKQYSAAVQMLWPQKLRAEATQSLTPLPKDKGSPDLVASIQGQCRALGHEKFKTYAEENCLLHRTIISSSYLACEYLLQLGCDPNVRTADETTPLSLAFHCAEVELIQLLLRHGADASLKDVHGSLPIHWLVLLPEDEVSQIVKMLVCRSRKKVFFDHASSLAFFDNLALIARGTALDWALACRNETVVNALLENGIAQPNNAQSLITCLSIAVGIACPQMTRCILRYSNCQSSLTAEDIAYIYGRIGANSDVSSDFRRWLMHGASLERAYQAVVDTLISFGICASFTSHPTENLKSLESPLYWAALSHNAPLVQEFLRRGVKVNELFGSFTKRTALEWAIINSPFCTRTQKACDTVKLLQDCGGTTQPWTPIYIACTFDAPKELMQLLISSNPRDINVRWNGRTPLNSYLRGDCTFCKFKLLVDAGADIHSEDVVLEDPEDPKAPFPNRTPLAGAIICMNWSVVEYLLDHGASLEVGVTCHKPQSVLHILACLAYESVFKKSVGDMEALLSMVRKIMLHPEIVARRQDLVNHANYCGLSPLKMAVELALPFLVDIYLEFEAVPGSAAKTILAFCDAVITIDDIPKCFRVEDDNLFFLGYVDHSYTSTSIKFIEYKQRLEKIRMRVAALLGADAEGHQGYRQRRPRLAIEYPPKDQSKFLRGIRLHSRQQTAIRTVMSMFRSGFRSKIRDLASLSDQEVDTLALDAFMQRSAEYQKDAED